MITPTILSDTAIRAAIQADLNAWNPAWGDRAAWSDEIAWSLAAAIDPLVANPEFRARYALTRGRPATDPAQLLRAVGLMHVRGTASLVTGRQALLQNPFLARLCGWTSPDQIPAIGTFYAFFRRQYREPRIRKGALRRPSGRRLKLKPGQKLPPRRPGAVERVARRVAREAARGRGGPVRAR